MHKLFSRSLTVAVLAVLSFSSNSSLPGFLHSCTSLPFLPLSLPHPSLQPCLLPLPLPPFCPGSLPSLPSCLPTQTCPPFLQLPKLKACFDTRCSLLYDFKKALSIHSHNYFKYSHNFWSYPPCHV